MKIRITNPMPRVPPVTRAVNPLSDHLLSLLLSSASAMLIFANYVFPYEVLVLECGGFIAATSPKNFFCLEKFYFILFFNKANVIEFLFW